LGYPSRKVQPDTDIKFIHEQSECTLVKRIKKGKKPLKMPVSIWMVGSALVCLSLGKKVENFDGINRY
jgi:hypothetical protein